MSALPTMPPIPWFTPTGTALPGGTLIGGAQIGGALIASPDSALRQQVLHRLNGRCRPVQQALGGADALAKLEKGDWQVLFLDRRLPDLDAEELMAIIQRRFPSTQVVMLDSDGARSIGIDGEIDSDINRAADRASDSDDENDEGNGQDSNHSSDNGRFVDHNRGSAAGPSGPPMPLLVSAEQRGIRRAAAEPLPGMIGTSDAMQRVYRMVRLVAARSTTVLVAGPTGTGKNWWPGRYMRSVRVRPNRWLW
jgi:CheY-like chemotaxis protein